MNKIKVTAAPGVRVPREENARRYIAGEPVEVERTAYYLRQIAAGDLIVAGEKSEAAVTATGAKATDKKDTALEVNGGQS